MESSAASSFQKGSSMSYLLEPCHAGSDNKLRRASQVQVSSCSGPPKFRFQGAIEALNAKLVSSTALRIVLSTTMKEGEKKRLLFVQIIHPEEESTSLSLYKQNSRLLFT